MGFLDGVRVVDATRLLPGAFCTMLLADMGAEVIKVEQPRLGDYMRATPPTKDGRSPAHASVNRNKLSIGIDLKVPEGKEVLRRLLKGADVFVEGFRPGVMKRLGFSFGRVKTINTKIVYCSVSGFGQKSKLSSMPGHDINFQAMAGTLGYSGRPETPLLQLSDIASGMYAALGILGGLSARKGATYVDVPMVASLFSWMVVPTAEYIATGVPPTPGSSLVFGSTPYYRLYETSDGQHIAVAAIEDEFWCNLLEVLGVPELRSKRFGTAQEQREAKDALERVFATKTRDQWASILLDKETCATPVLDIGEALGSAWAKEGRAIVQAGSDRVLNSALRSMPQRRHVFRMAPELGDDTTSIMRSLGYSKTMIDALRRAGAVE